ncbi:MAG: DUF3656 domain-containing protein [Verrucomicrobiota bacterium]|nr:DUF3656 domain-containing protein [Verrucomicrobiota bacterium]
MPENAIEPEIAGEARLVNSLPELLAPAGDWECAKAAVENGADAIYFGLERFNARMRARNFTEADLPALMEFLHRRGVRGYVTFNTLVFTNELAEAEEYLKSIIRAGVDAAIVQDVGICRLIRRLSPDFPIHASTQMTITSAAGLEFARELGCNLVVLARECSMKEIADIRAATTNDLSSTSSLPLEVFVHGALCVAYSGQCLTSESLGGRSANRGECAQACRMPYELISNGKTVPLGYRKYLLSPQDLAGIEVLPELVRAGVSSLKIEGRLKSPEYVANITRVYRQALQRISENRSREWAVPAEEQYRLEMGFSRGLYTGWFKGINNQELAHARFGKKRGVYLGNVTRMGRDGVFVKLESSLKRGDGVVFDAGKPEGEEQGGRVYDLLESGTETLLLFGRGAIDLNCIQPGNKVWKTSDPELDKELRQSFAGEQVRFQRPLHFEVHAALGQPLTVIARDEEGHVLREHSAFSLEMAQNRPLSEDLLREQLGRLGGTPFHLGKLTATIEGTPMVPVSELNRMRRSLVERLTVLRSAPSRWVMNDVPAISFAAPRVERGDPELIGLVRSMEQLEAILQTDIKEVYCEFEDPKKYRQAVQRVRDAGEHRLAWVAPPRITKPGEEWILKQVLSSGADGYLVRNYDHLQFFEKERCRGDFSLNVANPITAEYFINRFGLERVTASYDLNVAQLQALLGACDPSILEITLHQHMPMFHMEHCVFCAFLSNGTDYRNCGRPCDEQEVKIRDRVGAEHPLKADAGCRNTVFNARAQTGAEFFQELFLLGARSFRLEFLNEEGPEVIRTIEQYRKLLRGEISGIELWRDLKLVNQLGVTRGQLKGLK